MPRVLTTHREDGTRPLKAIVGWGLIGALLIANYWIFDWLGSDYIHWYIHNGAVIGLVFALISAAVDLDRFPRLISAHPSLYAGAWEELIGTNVLLWPDPAQVAKGDLGADDFHSDGFDSLVGALFGFAIALLGIAWALVIAPAQYLVVAVCGAPARMALASRSAAWIKVEEGRTTFVKQPRSSTRPAGSFEAGIVRRPVTFTNALGAASIWALSFVT